MSKGIIVGITGGIACGKSTVSRMLEGLGAALIDVDSIGHELLKKGSQQYEAIVELFGKNILDCSGEIDRTKLGKIVFSCEKKLKQLNAIMHPPMIEKSMKKAQQIIRKRPQAIVIIDSPLLIEAGLHNSVDLIVVVVCEKMTQITRLMERGIKKGRPLSPAEAQNRIQSQMPIEEKLKYADFVIENDGDFDELRKKVERLWSELQELNKCEE